MKKNKEIIAVAMSGGVDSSVAAVLLKEEGFEVIGLTMHLWDYHGVGGNVFHEASCCSLESFDDARAVCQRIGVPYYVIDVRPEFRQYVIDNFIVEYLEGRTPNPCIVCNSMMKWTVLFEKAKKLGATNLATGHYAQVVYDAERKRYVLKKGKDHSKDQSYALWALTQSQLARTKFPLGNSTKKEVRQIASDHKLKTKNKPESQDICFVPDNDYGRFLKEQHPNLVTSLGRGEIVDTQGNVMGYHAGFPHYTIGQRKKLGIAVGKPLYVLAIDADNNRIVVGDKDDLNTTGLIADLVNWIAMEPPEQPIEVFVKIRYKDAGRMSTVQSICDGKAKVIFNEAHQAVTPGQSAVFYQDDIVVGGGIIEVKI